MLIWYSNRVPWAVLTGFCGFSALILFILRTHLALENKRRNDEKHDDKYDDVYMTHVEADGTTIEKKVDRVSCRRLLHSSGC